MAGISARQGGHQVAQKLTSTTLPRRSDREICPPPNKSSVKSGALNPSRGLGGAPVVALAGTREAKVQMIAITSTMIDVAIQRRSFFNRSPMSILILIE